MGSVADLVWGIVFGSIGFGYFLYGKRQMKLIPLWCGVGLMVYPYFMPNTIVLVLAGLLLSALPYFFRE